MPGGKSLVARLPEETLGIQPAPDIATVSVADLLPDVNPRKGGVIRFHPDRWVKTYTHWMRNLKDWCISRQLWWGHRIPVWYNETGRAALRKPLTMVEQSWDEVRGDNAAAMREHALQLARERGILNSDFLNLDTGWNIYVQKSSLEHAFSNRGLQNIKLVPALPRLLRHAVLVGTEFHRPPAPDVRAVHTFLALLKLGFRLYRVTFTVKELASGRKLYDHQAVRLLPNQNGLDGKYPPEARLLAETLAPRPASSPQWTVADLLGDVNRSEELVRVQSDPPGPGWEQDPDVLDTWFSSWLWH
ncbi:MAG: class I tRNA ligase family protein, partial [Verrucomicrobiae bacterium]|nr:class I tRNA ligase family protein [Verrucomicrobiae bacterium]